MRVAIITESFPPDLNGVAHSVVRVAEHLVARGHEPLVIAPAPASTHSDLTGAHAYPVIRVPSLPVPLYRSFRLGLPGRRLTEVLIGHAPDVVHLASPFVLGARGLTLARRLRLPTLAVYQTDVAAYARAYHLGWSATTVWRWLRDIHNAADLTLAPSTAAAADLVGHGIDRVRIWGRGIDPVRFSPARRCEQVHRLLAPGGEVLVGYVGRLAAEKRVDLLAATSRLPGVRVVVIGDGPARRDLERALPGVRFLGARHGDQLARLYASLDIFVHTGPHETFGQTVQEAQASGVPVIAPAAGGPVDLITPGGTGLLVPAGDERALAAAVAGLAADPRRRRDLARAARTAVAERTWAAIGDELIDHYRAVSDEPGVPARVPVAA